jgi:hypothetical protein
VADDQQSSRQGRELPAGAGAKGPGRQHKDIEDLDLKGKEEEKEAVKEWVRLLRELVIYPLKEEGVQQSQLTGKLTAWHKMVVESGVDLGRDPSGVSKSQLQRSWRAR